MERPPAILEVVAGNAAGTSILLHDELLIGRLAEGPGQLGADDELSRSHATLSRDSSGYLAIEDLGSTNGTFVNGLRITSPQTLDVGDSIEVGATTLVVRDVPVLGAVYEPPVSSDPTPVGAGAVAAEPLEPPTVPATLGLRLEVDFAAREARILLDFASEPVVLRYDAGEWRAVPASN
jgi:hypothetical protein